MTSLFPLHIESEQDHVPDKVHAVEWSTPREVFAPLHEEFGFTLDVCASPSNAKCARFFTRSDDGLQQSWAGERCWMNPPYARGVIDHWMQRAAEEVERDGGGVPCGLPGTCVYFVRMVARLCHAWRGALRKGSHSVWRLGLQRALFQLYRHLSAEGWC